MPALVESEEEEEEDTESKDPLPEKLQNSMVTREDWIQMHWCDVSIGSGQWMMSLCQNINTLILC